MMIWSLLLRSPSLLMHSTTIHNHNPTQNISNYYALFNYIHFHIIQIHLHCDLNSTGIIFYILCIFNWIYNLQYKICCRLTNSSSSGSILTSGALFVHLHSNCIGFHQMLFCFPKSHRHEGCLPN